jgi:hypothetical protein
MTPARILRNGWMDLLSAAAILVVWLMRERLDYDTLRALLLWPVVLELFVALALLLAGMLGTIRSAVLRNAWFGLVACAYLMAAWLAGERAGMPQVWILGLWLLVARLTPPTALRFGSAAHRDWLWAGAGHSGLLWGAGFVATVLLMFAFSSQPIADAGGELRSTSPAWIFPLVWTPYFLAEAVLRTWRQPAATAPRQPAA